MNVKSVTTLRDLARMAGVAPSTVSRALHGDPRIRESTRKRIVALAEERGYWSIAARPIGVVIANPLGGLRQDAFFHEVVDGILAYRGAGRPVSIEATDAKPRSPLPKLLRNPTYAGVIVAGIPMASEWIESLQAHGVPSVFIGRYTKTPEALCAVLPDNRRGGRLVADHLVAQGYDDFWFIGGDLSIHTFADRYEGFRTGLLSHGFDLPESHITITAPASPEAAQAVGRLVPQMRGRSAIFCATDWQASGALQALRAAGKSVPDEVGIAGYSDLELTQHTSPTLTSVCIDRKQLGFLACRLLEDRIVGRVKQPVQVVIQPELRIRESTLRTPNPEDEGVDPNAPR